MFNEKSLLLNFETYTQQPVHKFQEKRTEIEWGKPAFQFYGFTSFKIWCKLFNKH